MNILRTIKSYCNLTLLCFDMKFASFGLTLLLLLVLIGLFVSTYYNYISFSRFGMKLVDVISWQQSTVIAIVINAVVFVVSIFLNIRKKYRINAIVIGLYFAVKIISSLLTRFT